MRLEGLEDLTSVCLRRNVLYKELHTYCFLVVGNPSDGFPTINDGRDRRVTHISDHSERFGFQCKETFLKSCRNFLVCFRENLLKIMTRARNRSLVESLSLVLFFPVIASNRVIGPHDHYLGQFHQ